MKQNFYVIIVILSMTVLSSSINAKSMGIVDMQISLIDPSLETRSHPKSPVEIPDVSIVDHTLYFDTPCDGCTLNIVDENNVVVYTLVIPTGTTSLVLLSTLSGEYELQIISGNYLFYGTINLP